MLFTKLVYKGCRQEFIVCLLEKKLQEMFFNSRGLVEAEELRKLKVKRTVSLAFCQDCQQPRVLLFMMPRPLPHTDSTVIHLIASDSFK